MHKELDEATERLKIKIEKLIHLHNKLREDNNVLQEENKKLKTLLDSADETMKLQMRMQEEHKLSGNDRNEKKSTRRDEVIDDLVREIDRCIKLLSE